MRTPKQFNNITERVIDDLKTTLTPKSRLSIAAASFSIYAFEALKDELEQIDELRFIFTSPTFNQEKVRKQKREFYIPKLNRERNLYGSEFEIRLRNQLSQRAIARECADWIRRKVRFKTNVSEGTLNNFMNVSEGNDTYTYLPFNEMTTTELGCERGNNLCPMSMGFPSTMATDHFLRGFDQLWNDNEKFTDVTNTVLENIETVYKENSPEFIYFVAIYNIFNEFLKDINEDVLPNEGTGFRNSQVWSMLYNFQKDAALAIINKLEKYNGCILADSVGLGKTFSALAVIKYYECRNRNVSWRRDLESDLDKLSLLLIMLKDCRQFNRETKDGKDMRHYSELLQQAINSIIEVKAESDIDSLFSPGETTALQGDIKGMDDFELITFLVIK